MIHIEEEYKVNRLRGLVQMIQTGDRMKGRQQATWIQEELVKELISPEPCMEIIREMKEILQDMGMEVEMTEQRGTTWKIQTGVGGLVQQEPRAEQSGGGEEE